MSLKKEYPDPRRRAVKIREEHMRKLIKPSMADIPNPSTKPVPKKKVAPPFQTHAENFYYLKQMNARTPLVFVVVNGEEIRGTLEWYDEKCLKINRLGLPNLLVYKNAILYIFKDDDRDVSANSEDYPYHGS